MYHFEMNGDRAQFRTRSISCKSVIWVMAAISKELLPYFFGISDLLTWQKRAARAEISPNMSLFCPNLLGPVHHDVTYFDKLTTRHYFASFLSMKTTIRWLIFRFAKKSFYNWWGRLRARTATINLFLCVSYFAICKTESCSNKRVAVVNFCYGKITEIFNGG